MQILITEIIVHIDKYQPNIEILTDCSITGMMFIISK